MKKYMLFFLGLPAQPQADDARTRAYNQKWMEWTRELATAGKLESGLPLEPTAKAVTRDGVTDHRLEKQDVYGYMLIKGGSLEEAIATARQAPHIALGGTTIVRPCVDIESQG
jgi:hypothetical protein